MKQIVVLLLLFVSVSVKAQLFEGTVSDANGKPISQVRVFMLEEKKSVFTDAQGNWQLEASANAVRTLVFHRDGYTYEQLVEQTPEQGISVVLRKAKASFATQREENYKIDGCASVQIPDDPEWNISFEINTLKGDLAPDPNFTRRDPSAVIKVGDTYYMWYSFSHTFDENKIAPWDLNDIYYATSKDGWTWQEQGLAVGRGEPGSFDHRSVFTTEIFVHDGKYYLVYQAAGDEDGIYNRNVVAMAWANSPDGPWTKLDKPLLYPTYTDELFFDNNAVHDPCIVFYNSKFYLYYKGECNCQGAAGCKKWCNPVCGLNKQVKWGVAIADSPTGPYVKSEYNPITNTGHEVMVWPYKTGIAILQHQDGPEAKTIQYAADGFNFEIKGKVNNIPEAAGLFRAPLSDNNPHAGVTWGVGHQLKWDAGPKGWMYIYRFDKVSNKPTGLNIIPDKIQLGKAQSRKLVLKLRPFDADASLVSWSSQDTNVATVDQFGNVTGQTEGTARIVASISSVGKSDTCWVQVTQDNFTAHLIEVEAENFETTGGTFNDATNGGPGLGMNKTATGVNFVNKNDWASYRINVPEAGVYMVAYQISTPSDHASISLWIDNEQITSDEVYNNGAWNSYYTLYADNKLTFLNSGEKVLKLVANGSNTWQWNLQSLTLLRLSAPTALTSVFDFPLPKGAKICLNRSNRMLSVSGLHQLYDLSVFTSNGSCLYSSEHSGNSQVQLSAFNRGCLIVRIGVNNSVYTSKMVL